jgi:tRNA dimethylallyltransferase
MSKVRPPLFLIAGPTASGKSSLALEWARRSEGAIVNADASQIYRDLPVLSAAPGPDDLAAADHRLFGTIDGREACSAATWAGLAKAEIAEIHASGRPAMLVGGTGLYLRTLLDGIAPVSEIDPAIRAEVRAASVEENRLALERLDPEAAERLKPADRQRIARSLEVVRSTGQTLGTWQQAKTGGIALEVALRSLVLLPPRTWLYERCDRRFGEMLDSGAIEEVEALLDRRLDHRLPVMRAIGVAEIADYLDGSITWDAMFNAGMQATRRYAKRQYTWFAHQPPPDWPRFAEALDKPEAVERALALLSGGD